MASQGKARHSRGRFGAVNCQLARQFSHFETLAAKEKLFVS
jgi:hypothetical protein